MNLDVIKEKKYMERFLKELVSDNGLAAYGEEEVRNNLQMGSVEVLLLSEDLRRERLNTKCTQCGDVSAVTVTRRPGEDNPELAPCKNCNGTIKVTDSIDVVNELSTLADQMSTRIEFISTDFEEGAQLMNAFGGMAAILRYKTSV